MVFYRTQEEIAPTEECGIIQKPKKLGYRAIVHEINSIPHTIGYELKRGTLEYSNGGRMVDCFAMYGVVVEQLHQQYGERFREVFRTIMTDN